MIFLESLAFTLRRGFLLLLRHFCIEVEGGFFVGFALFLFVVGLADDEVAGDVEVSSLD